MKYASCDYPPCLLCSSEFDVGSCGRESAIWEVSKAAKVAEANQRTESLAQHKTATRTFEEREARLEYNYDELMCHASRVCVILFCIYSFADIHN